MNPLSRSLGLPLIGLALALNPLLQGDDSTYKPELFQSTKLVYADSFDGPLNTEFWEVRQSSTWVIEDGALTGGPNIDMTGQSQIDFKGVDFGSCQIDDLKLWEGL